MFEVFCPAHDTEVLLTSGRIERLDNGPDGITLTWVCWCGTRGVLRSGRSATPGRADAPAPPATCTAA